MKVKKRMKNKTTDFEIQYSRFPDDGEDIAKIQEWENGEGYDVFIGGGHIELTSCELMAIVALAGMAQCDLTKGGLQ
jgi:hypothetical protein